MSIFSYRKKRKGKHHAAYSGSNYSAEGGLSPAGQKVLYLHNWD